MNTEWTAKTVVTIDGTPSEKVIISSTKNRTIPVGISRSTIADTWILRHVTSRRVIDWTPRSEQDAIDAAIEYAKRLAPMKYA